MPVGAYAPRVAVDVSPVGLRRVATLADEPPEPGGFAPPPPAARTLARPALLRRLRESGAVPVVLVCAPAGYGKTALLSLWAGTDPRPVAWLTLGPEHRDAGELVSDLLAALGRLAGRGGGPRPLGAPTALAPIRRAVTKVRAPALLVVDDAHLLADTACLEAVGMVCDGLPPGSQVALACRAEPALRWGLLRARGRLMRLGPRDLAMDADEAGRLLGAAGARLGPVEAAALLERTEGWPAGLSLGGADGDEAIHEFLEDEVLGALTPAELHLLTRSSVLGRLSPAACDAILGTPGSGRLLAGLARRGLLVAEAPPARDVYRHHRLIGEALRARLARLRPAAVPALHGAASDWFARAGDAERAIGHARAAGATGRLGRLVWDALPGRLATGRLTAVRGWLAPGAPDEIGAVPALAIAAAWCGLEGGGEVEHWIDAAERAGRAADDDGVHVAAAVALLGATAAREGAARMAEEAAASLARWPGDSPWRALACAVEGIALDAAGDRQGALDRLGEGARRAGPALPWIDLLCRSWLAVIALREGAWARAERLCEHAGAALRPHDGLAGYASAALAHSSAALLLARAGRADEARRRRALARRLLAVVPDLSPWRLVAARVLLARASALMGDPAASHGLLEEAAAPLALLGDAPAPQEDVAAAREAAEGLAPGARRRRPPLTAAEARVLRFLPTHHSFREIGELLHLSRFTVKSQALAVYRKLGAGSRGEAVARARALGLLDDAAPA
jgi:LuxR family transcriptional regulator, maltose regulon positive regulatory protein